MKKALALSLLLFTAVTLRADEALQTFPGCTLVEAEWADGDSFPVRLPDGRQITTRLYGADCIEWHVNDETLARRLRAQRRYFGIADTDAASSMKTARDFGKQAALRTRELLTKPFTVHTAFAGARGNGEKERAYAFVTTAEGKDLATVLVDEGLARAFGVTRQLPDGTSGNEYREALADHELTAAAEQKGIWAVTDWNHIVNDRAEERRESAELQTVLKDSQSTTAAIDPNTATAEELQSLPGIGKKLAERIIEARTKTPIRSIDDLLAIKGITPKLAETLTPKLQFSPP
ncbi:MAG: helix-hairpin-helix domain-containing protein [Verrucomicrobia bacterium]|nr:helix-hairpin-helix domain-containing protein [Verrucomicrobiota bacterium]